MDEGSLHFQRADPLLVNTPQNVVQCHATTLSWSGGTPPYDVWVRADTGVEFASVYDTTVLWVFAFTAGSSAQVSVVDVQGLSAASSHFSINHGPDEDCEGGAIPTIAFKTSASSTSSTESKISSATSTTDITSVAATSDTSSASSTTPASSKPFTSSKPVLSSSLTSNHAFSLSSTPSSSTSTTSSSQGTSFPATQSSLSSFEQIPTGSTTNKSSRLGSRDPSAAALIGIIVAAVVVVIGAVFLLLCFRRQRPQRPQPVGGNCAVDRDGRVVLEWASGTEGSLAARSHIRKSHTPSSIYTSSRRAASLSISTSSTPARSQTMQNRFSNLATLGHASDPASHSSVLAAGEGSLHAPRPSEYSTAFESSARDSDHALDGGVRLAGGRPGSEDGHQPSAPYAYKENRPTGALPPRYTSIPATHPLQDPSE